MRFNRCILVVMSAFVILCILMSSVAAADNGTQILTANDEDLLASGEGTFSELSREIGSGGDINLTKSIYTYDSGSAIQINRPGTIDGKGAVIDMANSNVRVFNINVADVCIRNITFKNANISNAGGAIYAFNDCIIEDCTFINNSAGQFYGGAVVLNGGLISNCNFTNNSAGSGGAVILTGSMDGCNFEGNDASDCGGAVYVISGKITRSSFRNNHAPYAGAVFTSNCNISSCEFIKNTALEKWGGAIFAHSANVEGCTFTDNSANQTGGAISFNNEGNVSKSSFINNSASGGGAIWFGISGNVVDSNFTDNHAYSTYGGAVSIGRSGNVTGCNFKNNSGYGGGALYIPAGKVTYSNFTDNSAGYGGAVYSSFADITGSDFINNSASIQGGAVLSNTINIVKSAFIKNSAPDGGAIYAFSTNVTDCDFTGNHVSGTGAAIYFNDKGNVKGSDFTDNHAESMAGAIAFMNGDGVVEYSSFKDNSANISAGGAILFDGNGIVRFSNFTNNSAFHGGAVFLNSGKIENCDFKNNSAVDGGALAVASSTDVSSSSFTGNIASVYGSAVAMLSNADRQYNFKDSIFLNNRAGSGNLTISRDESIVTVVFTANNRYLNAIYSAVDVNFKNVTYWGADGIMNTDSSTYYRSNRPAGQNITITVNDSGIVDELVMPTDINGTLSFNLGEIRGAYIIAAYHKEDSYYNTSNIAILEFSTRIPSSVNLTQISDFLIRANVTAGATRNVTFTVRDVLGEIVKTQSIVLENSTAFFDFTDLGVGKYNITAYYSGDKTYDPSSNSIMCEIQKSDSVIIVGTKDINAGENESITISINNGTDKCVVWVNGRKYDVNESSLVLESPESGDYYVTVIYYGNGLYNPASNSSAFRVLKHNVSIDVGDVYVNVDDDAVVNVTVSKTLAGQNLTVSVNSQDKVVDVDVNGKASVEFTGLANGTYEVIVSYAGDSVNCANSTDARIFVSKTDPVLESQNINISVGDDAVIEFSSSSDRNAGLIVSLNNINYSVNLVNGKATLTVRDLPAGNYKVNATYLENDKYVLKTFEGISSVAVNKIEANISIDAKDIKVGDNGEILIVLPADADGDVIIKLNDETISNFTKNDNIIKVNKLIQKSGNYALTFFLENDTKYLDSNKTAYFEASKVDDYDIFASASDVVLGERSTLALILPKDATGNVSINGKSYAISESILLDIQDSTGIKLVYIEYPGDDKYSSRNTAINYTVNKAGSRIDIDVNDTYLVGEDITIVLTPVNSTGLITLSINGIDYDVINNTVVIPGGLENATYSAIAGLEGDDNYLESLNISIFRVNRAVEITVSDVIKYYSGPEMLNVSVTDNGKALSGKTVLFDINGITYVRLTDEDGVASLAVNLACGNYTVNVNVPEFGFSKDADVFVKSTIYGEDVVKVFRNATQYDALFLDGNGNSLANTTVKFNINGVIYNRTTDASAWARLNINLRKGSYILTATNPVTGEMKSNNITVISKLQTNNLTKYFRNDSQFVVRAVADDGTYAGAGETVTFNINGVFYNRTTNETGHAKLNINLRPGDYIITSYYDGCSEGNTIHVLPTLTGNDLNMTYGDKSQFTANLVDGQGNPYADQSITFNINGVFYNRTTDANGDAKLSINLQAGEYIITSSYGDAVISNKITINS